MNGNYSVITNFGCHWRCPYCIVRNAHMDIPKTDMDLTFDTIKKLVEDGKIKSLSFSGGGDPLFDMNEERFNWYKSIIRFARRNRVKTSIHTSYTSTALLSKKGNGGNFLDFDLVSYHMINSRDVDLDHTPILKLGDETKRAVFVVQKDFTPTKIQEIVKLVKRNPYIDQLSFRQLINPDYSIEHTCEEYLRDGHRKDWYYIEQGDYNTYIVNDKISTCFEDFKEG